METDDGVNKPPHLTPPPYVHHFDTFTVVRSLEEGGFTEEQSVGITKLMRLVLAENMDLARDGIMSKADAEMVSYPHCFTKAHTSTSKTSKTKPKNPN